MPDGPPCQTPPSRAAARFEALLVLAVTLGFALAAGRTADWDTPLGDGWNRYLENAIAIREGEWSGYLRWRGPVHAWLCLGVLPLTGTLVRASQALSLTAATLTLPLTWLLGRRLLTGWTGLLGMLLLAVWPDLRLFARFSSPYALDAALFAAAAWTAAEAIHARGTRLRLVLGIAGGVLLGLGIATDLRFLALSACVALAVTIAPGRAGLAPAALLAIVAVCLGYGLMALLPVPLYTLGQQVALQRDLAASFVRECARRGPAAPGMSDMLGACGRAILHLNLARGWSTAGIPGVLLGAAALAGAAPRSPQDVWRRALLVLPLVPLTPALAIILVQHRYLLPVAPLVALLCAAGMVRAAAVTEAVSRRWGPGFPGPRPALRGAVLIGVIAALAGVGARSPSTLLARHAAAMAVPDPVEDAADAIREGWRAGDRVLDCANGNLRQRLYPIPVEKHAPAPRAGRAACAALLSAPPVAGAWVLVRDAGADPGWSTVSGPGQAPAAIRLFH